MSKFEEEWEDIAPSEGWLLSKAVLWSLIGLGTVIVVLVTWFAVKPSLVKMDGKSKVAVAEVQRDVAKNSHQYVEGKESMLLTWLDEYRSGQVEIAKARADGQTPLADALEMQNKALADRIMREAQRLPEEQLPASVKDFMEEVRWEGLYLFPPCA